MENASKALVMAGGVLIGVLLLSLAVYLFADFGSMSAKINAQNAEQQIVEFNSRFTSYEGYKDKDGNWKITIYDIISLASYAKEYNDYYEGTSEDKIEVKIASENIEKLSDYQDLIDKYTENGILTIFSCKTIKYGDNGKVNSITFKKEH